jgi:hypothetical protein
MIPRKRFGLIPTFRISLHGLQKRVKRKLSILVPTVFSQERTAEVILKRAKKME